MDFIAEFIGFLLQCAFWYFIISLLLSPIRNKLEAKNEELQETVNKIMDLVHRVSVEKHGEVFYWFDADSDEFLAQGKTTDETIAHLKSRFPSHICLVKTKETQFKISAPTWEFTPIESK